MFTVTREGGWRIGTFRLQLFTSASARPVAVATQGWAEGGSLTNCAETYAAEVWRRCLPQETAPPIWIELQMLGSSSHPDMFTLVTFGQDDPYELADPKWCRMSDADMAQLVGGPVDRGRGEGYRPAPVPPEPQPVHQVAWVALLPAPHGMDRGCLAVTPPAWWQRAARQLAPRRQVRDCCYYHSINWHRVSAAAIRIVRQVRAEGLTGDALADRLDSLAGAERLPGPERRAVQELLAEAAAIQFENGSRGRRRLPYINGRHRVTAMLESGVRRTVVVDWEMPTSAPAADSG